jgi:hypothetical protein
MNKPKSKRFRRCVLLLFVAGGILLIVGCGQRKITLSKTQTEMFDEAPAEIKQVWDKALMADQTNDYLNAQNLLDSLASMNLNSQQAQALSEELASFQQRLLKAADKGDPAAVKAIQEMNKSKRK